MSLEGKHALITGSSRGIGRGIALKLAENGVRVAVHYYQDESAAQSTAHPEGSKSSSPSRMTEGMRSSDTHGCVSATQVRSCAS